MLSLLKKVVDKLEANKQQAKDELLAAEAEIALQEARERASQPEPLPVGMKEFDSFVKELMSIFPMPTASENDVKWVTSATIVNLPYDQDKIAKSQIAKIIWAGAAKQVAGEVFRKIKEEQAEATKKANEQKNVAETSSETSK